MPEFDPDKLSAIDGAAYERLFELHYSELCRFAYRYVRSVADTEDLVQEVFLRLWRQRAEIGLDRDLKGYLYQAVKNQSLDALRRRGVRDRYIGLALGEPESLTGNAGGDAVDADEIASALRQALGELPDRQREVMLLRWQQRSYDEIAATLGISPKTVAVHITRAVAKLREILPPLLA